MAKKKGEMVKYRGIWHTLSTIVKEEGVIALYKGNGMNVLRVIPVYALKFSFNDTFKDMVKTPGKPLNFLQLISVGTLAGLFQICVTYPLDSLRTRLTLGKGLGMHHKSAVALIRDTIKTEGFGGLYVTFILL